MTLRDSPWLLFPDHGNSVWLVSLLIVAMMLKAVMLEAIS